MAKVKDWTCLSKLFCLNFCSHSISDTQVRYFFYKPVQVLWFLFMDVLWLQDLSPLQCSCLHLRAPGVRQLINPSPLFTVCLYKMQTEWMIEREMGSVLKWEVLEEKRTEANKGKRTAGTKRMFAVATSSPCMWVSVCVLWIIAVHEQHTQKVPRHCCFSMPTLCRCIWVHHCSVCTLSVHRFMGVWEGTGKNDRQMALLCDVFIHSAPPPLFFYVFLSHGSSSSSFSPLCPFTTHPSLLFFSLPLFSMHNMYGSCTAGNWTRNYTVRIDMRCLNSPGSRTKDKVWLPRTLWCAHTHESVHTQIFSQVNSSKELCK